MAQVEGLNLRGSRYYVRIVIPDDLQGAYGKARVNPALGTSDRREATLLATVMRAKWLADFDIKRSERNPSQIDAITPDLAAHLAALVRIYVLSEDDRLRGDVQLLAELVHIRSEFERKRRHPLRLPQWEPTEKREDDLSGLTTEEVAMLSTINAQEDSNAAMALAGGNLKAVLPLVQAQAAKLGLHFDTKTPGAREALQVCLRAFRAAHREVTLRDAGEVVETPQRPTPPAAFALEPHEKPKSLRDVFDRWKRSGDTPRKEDSIKAMGRTLQEFEQKQPGITLRDISREMGDAHRAWLLEKHATPKTARDRLTGLKTLLKYACRDLEWTQRHTWEGLDIKAKTTNKRRKLTDDEMSKLFGTPLHSRYELPKAKQGGREAAYWILLIGAFTGARLAEVCQLRVADVQTVDGIPSMVLTNEVEGQTIKSDAGHRTIPVHSELIRLGFLGYVAAMRGAGHATLWPALPIRKGKNSDYFGRWFLDFRKGLGMETPTFHYFRHTVRPLMRNAGIDSRIMDRITGHAGPGSVGDRVYDEILLAELRPGVEAIRYPGLSLPVVSPHATRKEVA